MGVAKLLRVYAPRGRVPGVTYLFDFLPAMVRAARAYRPNFVIQAVAGSNTGLMWLLARLLRVPFIYRCANDIDVDNRVASRLSTVEQRLFRLGFTNADAYLPQNHFQANAIEEMFPGKPCLILHNPFLKPDLRTVVAREGRNYVAWLGVFQPQKNLSLLARIAAAMPTTQFRVGGRPEIGMSDPATLQALEALKTMSNVTFVGYLKRTEVPSFLSRSIALLSTSHYEGFSNTFLEAWGSGTPMVAPAAVDPDGLVAANGLGKVTSDPEDLADALREIVSLSPAAYDALSHHCCDYVLREHDPTKLADALVNFLENLGARG
jgi:glycosyltransferase involved in cell wall biosynthesis